MTRSTPRTDWLTPDWPAPAGVHAICTTRMGGVSHAPYDSLNLGDHVGDDQAHVASNRAILQQAIVAKPVFLNQVHGTEVLRLDATTPNASVADACLTDQLGIACTIMVADCLPVLFCSTDGAWVGAAHAGWRGLAGNVGVGVLEQTCKDFRALALMHQGQADTEVIAWLGPCIGPQAFEVGDEVRAAFVEQNTEAEQMFTPLGGSKWLASLAGLARQRLSALGITRVFGNDGSADWCTVTQSSRFFSHRRDRVSGRLAVCIWRDT
ncbi:peptidoglycan editing factor PgeF [Rhodoferax sp. U11-2br]|uniref:peptidoglycan editing factor PgeF n=1 Tax=Rhodoferax sp. U11-2br TaxID=2838878 RepID=UPI001BEB627F|nr:peptidoglycan editing factor PgeF [Rhodoferax sp. U11-2br]MBT3065230.1 peptidoglycan editing factor PgeF [Rhodoferax sp. U11-2br]